MYVFCKWLVCLLLILYHTIYNYLFNRASIEHILISNFSKVVAIFAFVTDCVSKKFMSFNSRFSYPFNTNISKLMNKTANITGLFTYFKIFGFISLPPSVVNYLLALLPLILVFSLFVPKVSL